MNAEGCARTIIRSLFVGLCFLFCECLGVQQLRRVHIRGSWFEAGDVVAIRPRRLFQAYIRVQARVSRKSVHSENARSPDTQRKRCQMTMLRVKLIAAVMFEDDDSGLKC